MTDTEHSADARDEIPSTPASAIPDSDAQRHALADKLYEAARSIRQTQRDQLQVLAEQSLELASQVGADGAVYEAGMANALSMLSYHSATQGASEASLSQAAQALALLDTSVPSTTLGDIYDAMGWALFTQGDFVEAMEALLKALHVARDIGDPGLEAYALDTMSTIHGIAGRWEEALEGHLRSLGMMRERGDELGVALVNNNMTYTYLGLGDTDAALDSALSALAYVEEHDVPHIVMSFLDTVATVYLARGDLETARSYAMRGMTLAKQQGNSTDECDTLMTLGQISLKQGNHDEALKELEAAVAMAARDKRSVEEYTGHELLARVHERRGEMAAALAEYHTFHRLERARFNEESETRLAHLRVEHQLDSAKKDAEIHRLRSLALEREVEERRLAQARLEAQASLDPLTGLYNRRHLEVLQEELRRALSLGEPVCLAIFDVDHFKQVNDGHGHLTGDRVLASIALQLGKNSRASDVPLRYGGDEFLVLLVGMNQQAGFEAAERIRSSVASTTVESDEVRIKVTVSAGVACADPDHTDLSPLIERADNALYAAKQAGRDRVVAG